jgi:predicted metal-dependent hydrolase
MKMQIGKIRKVPLREIWRREDSDFSAWLEENIDYLNDIFEFDISVESREEAVGPFRVDLWGEDNFGQRVIIENQLERTDHDHLGKVITYLTNLGANRAVWIAKEPRKEHIRAWSARLGVATQHIRIRAMKRKWGACRPRSGDIVLNLELAKHPPAAIDYVVLHELAHLLEASYGPRFQAILTEHMPDWRAVETALNGRVTTRG